MHNNVTGIHLLCIHNNIMYSHTYETLCTKRILFTGPSWRIFIRKYNFVHRINYAHYCFIILYIAIYYLYFVFWSFQRVRCGIKLPETMMPIGAFNTVHCALLQCAGSTHLYNIILTYTIIFNIVNIIYRVILLCYYYILHQF